MNYRITLKENLNIIDKRDINIEKLVNKFSQIGYELLYVYDNNTFINVITCKDLISNKVNLEKRKNYIVDIKEIKDEESIETLLINNSESEKIVVLKNNDVFFEINTMVEPPLQNNICKQIMSLRYVSYFKNELNKYFCDGVDIYLICNKLIYNYLKSVFPNSSFNYSTTITQDTNLKSYKYVFDFVYGKKLLKCLSLKQELADFSKIIEHVAFSELKKFCTKMGVDLWLFKLPYWDGLSCLSSLEMKNALHKTSLNELLSDNKYISNFISSEEDYEFIKHKKYNRSFRYDDGYAYVQANCFSNEINVFNGLRQTLPECIDKNNTIHLFGPCTTYGILVQDEYTIASYLQSLLVSANFNYKVENHGGMHGNNVLNSIMLALNTNVKVGDKLVLVDVLQDYEPNCCEHFVNMNTWFNLRKRNNETLFFDFPGHCNAKANSIMAECIYNKLLSSLVGKAKGGVASKYISDFNKTNLINETNPAFIKFLRKVKKYKNYNNTDNYCVFSSSINESIISEILPQNGLLYVFLSGENTIYTKSANQLLRLTDYFKDNPKVRIIQLEHYFCIEQFYLQNNNESYIREHITYIENLISKILDYLNIKTRYILSSDLASPFEILRESIVKTINETLGNNIIYV